MSLVSRFMLAGVAFLLLAFITPHRAHAEKPPQVYQIYLVREGDTLVRVAKQFGVSARAIRAANELSRRARIRPGQRLKIPVKRGPRAALSCDGWHRVGRGESIARIARACQVSARALRAANDLRPGQRLRPGQMLRIPGRQPHAYLPLPTQ